MWKCKTIFDYPRVVAFLNENNIKPENCKITEYHNCYSIFYYVEDYDQTRIFK